MGEGKGKGVTVKDPLSQFKPTAFFSEEGKKRNELEAQIQSNSVKWRKENTERTYIRN